ncbi:NAD-dependent epimerase/dehydratase family protein [Micromonospora rifamycinica]|uniref:UDP-glucose 4-epimerase n=1 Tax=Micromonospora rifamycinica TaxID=291594 RepID=A0A120F9P3_9ACTN|nr:NAD-dependent epimerase/dehydratase family protein [Micromonospora rifamycinica]KWV33694.1 GDP-mannose 4,6-dehydratase [Micromonospora rifamycinica]SCG49938.1 UDP-glucose 4-epimerase [Micromonospora rifamycinica]
MRILITGGAGFIGANLARAALAEPAVKEVSVLDDFSVGLRGNLDGLDVDLVEGSILDPAALDAAMAGREAVVHLAALPSVPRSLRDPLASHHANATGTLMVLEAARRHDVAHVLVASSSSVYGMNPALPKVELTWTRPMSPYAASKLATEAYALAHQASFGLPTLALRFFNVFGPGQRHDHAYAAVIPRFTHAALRGEPVVVHGDGTQSRDFTYVGTVCEVILDALRRRVRHPHPVNLAFGARASLLQVLDELESLLGRPIAREHVAPRTGDVPHSLADDTTLRYLFPDVTPVAREQGLRATSEWMAGRLGTAPAAPR